MITVIKFSLLVRDVLRSLSTWTSNRLPGTIITSNLGGKQKDWAKIGDFQIYPWSVAGVESCIVIRTQDLGIVFDMGYACRESVFCENVFIRSASVHFTYFSNLN